MDTLGISKLDLKELIKEAVVSALTERKDLLEEAAAEALLDVGLARAIAEGDTGEYSNEESVLAVLKP